MSTPEWSRIRITILDQRVIQNTEQTFAVRMLFTERADKWLLFGRDWNISRIPWNCHTSRSFPVIVFINSPDSSAQTRPAACRLTSERGLRGPIRREPCLPSLQGRKGCVFAQRNWQYNAEWQPLKPCSGCAWTTVNEKHVYCWEESNNYSEERPSWRQGCVLSVSETIKWTLSWKQMYVEQRQVSQFFLIVKSRF